jgi:hypothetical protein
VRGWRASRLEDIVFAARRAASSYSAVKPWSPALATSSRLILYKRPWCFDCLQAVVIHNPAACT